jgi:ribulose-phosphate 3-epimerase
MMLNQSEADWIHIDVMDGVFVPNITIGIPVIRAIKKYAGKPLDVHLMIVQPERYLEEFRKAGADIISVHYEASTHLHRTISEIKRLGAKAGVVLNPATSVSQLEDIINDVDMVLIMSVNPGFGGQKFIENTYKKLIQLKDLIFEKGSSSLVEVDGGVDLENSFQIIKSGGDILVAGNTVFSSQNPSQTISELKHISR